MADDNLEIKSFEELYSLPIGTVAVFAAKHDSPAFAKFGQEKYVAIMAPNDDCVVLGCDAVGYMLVLDEKAPASISRLSDGVILQSVCGAFLSLTGKKVHYRIDEASFNYFKVERLSPIKYVVFWLEMFDMVNKVKSAVSFPQRALF